MGALVTGVTALVRAMAPDHESRWSDSFVSSAIFLADSAIREEADVMWASYEFSMVDGAIYYALPTEIVGIRSVEFSRDGGTTYDIWLHAVTLPDMDDIDYKWQTSTGATPEMYFLQSAPGTTNYSKIGIWRPVVTAGNQKIRVNYTKCITTEAGLSGVTMPDEIMQEVYLPYVLSLLMGHIDPQEARAYLMEYNKKIGWARDRFWHNKAESSHRPRDSR